MGPLVLNLINPGSLSIKVLAELGAFFLMLHAGLETEPYSLFKGSKKSIAIAVGGVIVPFISGFYVSQMMGFPLYQSLFIALTISATAIIVSVRMLKDYKLTNTKFGQTILSAAIISDLLILIGFSAIIQLFETGAIAPLSIVLMLGKILLFFSLIIICGIKIQKYENAIFKNKGFTLTLILALLLGLVAEKIGLHVIIGAFMTGLFIREGVLEKKIYKKIEDRIYGLSYSFLGPIFFTTLAFNLDFHGLSQMPKVFYILLGVAVLGKFIGSSLPALIQGIKPLRSLMIGVAMNSRGAVDLILISVGLQKGIIEKDIFSVLILIAFITTLVSILALRPVKNLIIQKGSRSLRRT